MSDDEGEALERSARAARRAGERVNVDDDEDNSMFDTDEAYAAAGVYASQRDDHGNGMPMATAKARREEGYDEDMRELEVDYDELDMGDGRGDDEFSEGNDEYEGGGRDTMDAGPS